MSLFSNILTIFREMPYSELKSKYRKVSSIEKAHTGWKDEYDVSCRQVNSTEISDEIINYPALACLN